VLNDYNQYDMKKILEREIFMIKSHIDNMKHPEAILRIKSFVNSQEHTKEEILEKKFSVRQVISLNTNLNDLKVKSNTNIARLVDNVNNSGKYDIMLYVKIHKTIQPGIINSLIEVCGVEVPENIKKEDKTNKIVNMIKRSRESTDKMI
jgi:hypothetical protein